MINKVKKSGSGLMVNESFWIPKDEANSDYQAVQKWIADGGIIEPEFDLPELKSRKLLELDNYHYNSQEIRQCKINNYFILQLDSNGRSLIQEQITALTQKIELGVIAENEAKFEYFYTGGSIKITLEQLRKIYVAMLDIVNLNFQNYKKEIAKINNPTNLTTIKQVEDYDFTLGYVKNQNINI